MIFRYNFEFLDKNLQKSKLNLFGEDDVRCVKKVSGGASDSFAADQLGTQTEEQLGRSHLQRDGQRVIQEAFTEVVNGDGRLGEGQTVLYVIDQVSESVVAQSTQGLPHGVGWANQDAVVEQLVDVRNEIVSQLWREYVFSCHDDLFAKRSHFRRTAFQETHDPFGQRLGMLSHNLRVRFQTISHERQSLHLGCYEIHVQFIWEGRSTIPGKI